MKRMLLSLFFCLFFVASSQAAETMWINIKCRNFDAIPSGLKFSTVNVRTLAVDYDNAFNWDYTETGLYLNGTSTATAWHRLDDCDRWTAEVEFLETRVIDYDTGQVAWLRASANPVHVFSGNEVTINVDIKWRYE